MRQTAQRSWRVVGIALLAALALAGCKDRGSSRALARFGDDPVPATAPALANTGAPAGTNADPARTPASQVARRTPDAAMPEVDARPDRILGLAKAEIDARLGKPALIREEAPAEVWQYRLPACVLDVYFYPTSGRPEVLHLEARDADTAAPREVKACLGDLLRRKRAADASG